MDNVAWLNVVMENEFITAALALALGGFGLNQFGNFATKLFSLTTRSWKELEDQRKVTELERQRLWKCEKQRLIMYGRMKDIQLKIVKLEADNNRLKRAVIYLRKQMNNANSDTRELTIH